MNFLFWYLVGVILFPIVMGALEELDENDDKYSSTLHIIGASLIWPATLAFYMMGISYYLGSEAIKRLRKPKLVQRHYPIPIETCAEIDPLEEEFRHLESKK